MNHAVNDPPQLRKAQSALLRRYNAGDAMHAFGMTDAQIIEFHASLMASGRKPPVS